MYVKHLWLLNPHQKKAIILWTALHHSLVTSLLFILMLNEFVVVAIFVIDVDIVCTYTLLQSLIVALEKKGVKVGKDLAPRLVIMSHNVVKNKI